MSEHVSNGPSTSDEPTIDSRRTSITIAPDALGEVNKNKDPESRDVVIVNWNGPDDPSNPINWTYGQKWTATLIVSLFTFISPISSSMIAPAGNKVAEEFGIKSPVVTALTTSVFVLAYAFGPLLLGPLSEIFGRSRVLQLSNLSYLIWNTACGFARNTGQLIAFRFLAGLGGSAPLSIGGGVIGDIWSPHERGKAVAVYSLAPLLSPIVGPVAGAWIGEMSTWRWVFWSTSLFGVIVELLGKFFLRETYPPVILKRKAQKLETSKALEDGSIHYRSVYDCDDHQNLKYVMWKSLSRSFVLFYSEPIVQLLGIYMAFLYGVYYIFLTTIPSVFEEIYGEAPGIAGLHYIAVGVGLLSASQMNAAVLDPLYLYLERKYGNGRPEFRLPPMVPGTILFPIGLFIAGWAAQYRVFWLVTDIGIAFIGGGMILSFQVIQTYVVDTFTLHSASALAAVSFLRSLTGFGFPLFAPEMYKVLGHGKGDSILAVVSIVIGCPAPWLFWKYGERIRSASPYSNKDGLRI